MQLSSKDTDLSISRIISKSFRLQVQKLNLNNLSILWINVYFPVDGGDTDELSSLLAEIELLVESEGVSSVMLGGDLNYEVNRTTEHANIIKTWLIKMDLISVWDHYPIDFTHHHIDYSSMAVLDHFCVTTDLLNAVTSVGVYHHAEQFSRHDPIWVTFDFGQLKTKGKTGVNRK